MTYMHVVILISVLFSARPGRPPKRSAVNSTPDTLDSMKKSRGIINSMTSNDYFSPVSHIIGMYRRI